MVSGLIKIICWRKMIHLLMAELEQAEEKYFPRKKMPIIKHWLQTVANVRRMACWIME